MACIPVHGHAELASESYACWMACMPVHGHGHAVCMIRMMVEFESVTAPITLLQLLHRPRPSDSIDQSDAYAWHQVRRKLDHKFEAPFFRVTPEPGLQCHVNFNQMRRDVISRLSTEEHDLRLLRRALFLGRY